MIHRHSMGMVLITTWERGHMGLPKHKKSGLKLSKYTADTLIQHAFEENNIDKATVYTWAKKESAL